MHLLMLAVAFMYTNIQCEASDESIVPYSNLYYKQKSDIEALRIHNHVFSRLLRNASTELGVLNKLRLKWKAKDAKRSLWKSLMHASKLRCQSRVQYSDGRRERGVSYRCNALLPTTAGHIATNAQPN